jgi:hypothetical protein
MSDSVFKGEINTGTVSAKFQSDFSNIDSDLLVMSYSETGGANPQVTQEAVAPGGSASVSLDLPQHGVLEVWVVTGHSTDSGRLTVTRPGKSTHDEAINGSVRWVYAVV